ncbi:MAG: methionyl-tRNA formyltransferase [Bacteroidales bacterium]|nr:methionyl-tRNA formyltransferase [Bacteroidales bacterium]
MKKLDRFILTAFIGPFIAILLLVVFILMMQFLWVYIDELVGKGLGLGVVLEFMLLGGCTILPLALPLATLLSSMMVLGQMGDHNELMAIKAAGISLARVLLPLVIASVFISIGAFYVGNNLVPIAWNEIYTLRDDISRTKNEIKIPAGTFYDGIDGYVLRTETQDDNGVMHGVMVYDHTSNKGNTSLSLADSAVMKMSKNKDYLTFTLYNGTNYQENNVRKYRDTTLELQHIDFERQELIIPLKNYNFQKSDSSRYGDQAKSMRLRQLMDQKDSLDNLAQNALDNRYTTLSQYGVFQQKNQLDTAKLEARAKYSNYFSADGYLRWDKVSKKKKAYEKAAEAADRMETSLMAYQSEVYEYYFYLRRTNIELLKKFAQALACLLLFFIGAPLGAFVRKGALGVSAIISVLFFVLYWVVDITGTKLARDGAVGAPLGVFVSAIVLAPIGAYLTSRAIKDATLFSNDSLLNHWRKLKSKVARLFHQKRIVFMGTPEFAVASLDALLKAGYKVVGVVTVADKPSGRGLEVHESAVKKYAVEHGLPVLQPVKLKDPEFLQQLAAWKADLFVVVAFRMLPEEVWGMPKLGTFNLHAALLPQYRGAAPINWAVINGERMTGATTFMIDKDIDTGGIILRHGLRIGPEDTAGDVHDRLMELGAKLVVETTEGIIQHTVETRVQKSFIQGSEVLKPAPKLTKENTRIDWSAPAETIRNLVRGLNPYPSAWTTLVRDGKSTDVKIFSVSTASVQEADCSALLRNPFRENAPQSDPASAAEVSDTANAAVNAGEIKVDGDRLYVSAGDKWLEIKELQLAGKKRMGADAFLRGFREIESYKFV